MLTEGGGESCALRTAVRVSDFGLGTPGLGVGVMSQSGLGIRVMSRASDSGWMDRLRVYGFGFRA